MNRLIVKDIVGPYCGTYDDGVKLYRVIHSLLIKRQQVELDFEGVALTSSSFFNAAVGNLLQEFSKDASRLPVALCNVTPRDQFILDRTLEAARLVDKVGTES